MFPAAVYQTAASICMHHHLRCAPIWSKDTSKGVNKSKKLHLLYPYQILVQTLIPYFRWQWVKSMSNFGPKELKHILGRLCGFNKEWHLWFIPFLVLQTGELLEMGRFSLQAGSYKNMVRNQSTHLIILRVLWEWAAFINDMNVSSLKVVADSSSAVGWAFSPWNKI